MSKWQDTMKAEAASKQRELQGHVWDCACFGCMRKAEDVMKQDAAHHSVLCRQCNTLPVSDKPYARMGMCLECTAAGAKSR